MFDLSELRIGNNTKYDEGYRLVYFFDDENYSIGAYCKTIEGFMIGLAESDPIIDEDDIPEFVSNKDLLCRCLKLVPNAKKIALYNVNGNLIECLENNKVVKTNDKCR